MTDLQRGYDDNRDGLDWSGDSEQCGTTDKRKSYDWASISGNYSDITDYRRLCRSCHWKLDKKILNIAWMRERLVARD